MTDENLNCSGLEISEHASSLSRIVVIPVMSLNSIQYLQMRSILKVMSN